MCLSLPNLPAPCVRIQRTHANPLCSSTWSLPATESCRPGTVYVPSATPCVHIQRTTTANNLLQSHPGRSNVYAVPQFPLLRPAVLLFASVFQPCGLRAVARLSACTHGPAAGPNPRAACHLWAAAAPEIGKTCSSRFGPSFRRGHDRPAPPRLHATRYS